MEPIKIIMLYLKHVGFGGIFIYILQPRGRAVQPNRGGPVNKVSPGQGGHVGSLTEDLSYNKPGDGPCLIAKKATKIKITAKPMYVCVLK